MLRFVLTAFFLVLPLHAFASGDGSFQVTPFVGFVVNFLILFGGTGFLLRKKIARFFAIRAQQISEDLEEAKGLQDEAQSLIASCEQKLARLEAEQKEILERFHRDGEAEKARLIAEAKSEAERIRLETEFRMKQEIEKAKKRLLTEAVPLIIKLAEDAVVKRLDEKSKDQFVEEGIARLRNMQTDQLVQ